LFPLVNALVAEEPVNLRAYRGRWLKGKARVPGLGGRLRAVRLAAGLSLEAVAEALSVSSNTVWRWEKGRHEPSRETLEAIAEFYQKPVAWFLAGEQPYLGIAQASGVGEYRAQPAGPGLDEQPITDRDVKDLVLYWGVLTLTERAFVKATIRTALQRLRRPAGRGGP
jgi:transcriptional regulator with XRE-family HTH domain